LNPGQYKSVTDVQLHIATKNTTVDVHYDSVEAATEQLKTEEKQRVLGIIPNFYVSYGKDPAPLTAKMKFQLALKVSNDPVTTAGVILVAGAKQAGNSPKSGQGWGPFGERVGAVTADGFSGIMIGDFRRSCARLCHVAGGELEQIQFLLGHVSVQTTEKYLGCKQRIRNTVNDRIGIEPSS
jgi:hypothetical protein